MLSTLKTYATKRLAVLRLATPLIVYVATLAR